MDFTVNGKYKMTCVEAGIAFLLFLFVAVFGPVADANKKEDVETVSLKGGKEDQVQETQEVADESESKPEVQEAIAPGQYPIMGGSPVSVEQMVSYFESSNETYPAEVLSKGGAPDIETFCQIYYEEATAEGIRPEVPFAQTMKETGWLQYGGDSRIEQYNFAGLGTTGGGVEGEYFPDVRTGVRAQIQHLKAYASEDPLKQECVDTRYDLVTRGSAPYVEWLGKKENPGGYGWATAENYGYSIVEMIHVLRTY